MQYVLLIRKLAKKYEIGIANSYDEFLKLDEKCTDITKYMSQYNHPNSSGHQIIAAEIITAFQK